MFEENGVEYKLCHTEFKAHAVELAEKHSLEGFDAVVVIGGDG